ncbi:hypothetical protein PR202_ga19281 [Eleusine coracana subsp. coracana]|uniref:Uncharacterized protein n=1 Tax=Eleusine coracana subsp. coracana TaxID=191504 RepID=A0AAV5CW09_ELECO|nr:hypothetical protein PR202_ga19281 [Eleusine coracana subsp. coracana]
MTSCYALQTQRDAARLRGARRRKTPARMSSGRAMTLLVFPADEGWILEVRATWILKLSFGGDAAADGDDT